MIRTSLNILPCWLNRRSSTLVEERTSKKKKKFFTPPLNRKKITRFSHCCSQPVFATPWSFAPFRSRAFHFARLVPLHRDVFTRLSSYNFLPRIGTATSISKLLARTINSPPPPFERIHATENGHDSRGFKKRSARLEFAALVRRSVPGIHLVSK